MANRAEDWLEQAKRDLAHAVRSLESRDYEWACFAAQQAAEKAVKAVYQDRGEEAWGHAVSGLLEGLAESAPLDPPLVDRARELDRHYIPTRYPNAHPEGAPHAFYALPDALRAVEHAEAILAWCENLLAG